MALSTTRLLSLFAHIVLAVSVDVSYTLDTTNAVVSRQLITTLALSNIFLTSLRSRWLRSCWCHREQRFPWYPHPGYVLSVYCDSRITNFELANKDDRLLLDVRNRLTNPSMRQR
jgi:hypothetical protein